MGACPFIIGVAGGTASGKSSVCSKIIDRLAVNGGQKRVVSISQDSFYRDLANAEEVAKARRGDFNFDHPDAFEHKLMVHTLRELKHGKAVDIPTYDFRTQSRTGWKRVDAADVVLIEGILIFFDQELREKFDLKLFVDADPDIRLARRVERDTTERGRPLDHVLHQYLTLVKPAFEDFCLPTKKYADVIIPRGAENNVAIELIVQHIQEILRTPPPSDRLNYQNKISLQQNGEDGTTDDKLKKKGISGVEFDAKDKKGIVEPKIVASS